MIILSNGIKYDNIDECYNSLTNYQPIEFFLGCKYFGMSIEQYIRNYIGDLPYLFKSMRNLSKEDISILVNAFMMYIEQ